MNYLCRSVYALYCISFICNMTIPLPIAHWLDYCNYIVLSLKIMYCDSSNFITVFQNCFRYFSSFQFSSVAQSCPTLCDPMNRSTPGLPVHHQLPEFIQTHPLSRWCHSAISSSVVLLLRPIPPSIRVFSNESTLRMRWPESWSFSFSIIPSKEHPGLIHLST